MNIKKSDLLWAMTECIPGVEKGNVILEGVDTFVFEGKVLRSYNDNISVTVNLPLKEKLDGVIKSMDFYKVVSKLKEEETEITVKENHWIIKNGRSRAKINLLEDKISEYIENLKTDNIEWTEIPPEFMQAMTLCSIANNYSPHAGIFIKDKDMLSTDMRRLNFYTLSKKMEEFYLSDAAVKELLKFTNIKYYNIVNEWAHFKTDKDTIFSCRCMDAHTFPQKVLLEKRENMEKEKGDLTNSLPNSLKEVIDRVGALSRELNGNQTIQLAFDKKEITAYSFRESSGEITETVPLDKPFDEDVALEIWMDIPFLKEAINKVPDFYVKKIKIKEDGSGNNVEMPVVIFTAKNYTQIVATMVPND